MEVIPAMDLIDGQCVRLRQGDFNQKKSYGPAPLAVARKFEKAGFKRLHMVDLDGARSGSPKHLHLLEKIARETSLMIDFSGGIKTDHSIQSVFDAGAEIVALGSVAVNNKSLFFSWLDRYGAQKILLGVDVREEKLAISGWTEQTDIELFPFLKEMQEAGVRQLFCTDISKDGLMEGPALALYDKISTHFPGLSLIASGGVRTPEDLRALQNAGCTGAIVGKAIYEDFNNIDRWVNALAAGH